LELWKMASRSVRKTSLEKKGKTASLRKAFTLSKEGAPEEFLKV